MRGGEQGGADGVELEVWYPGLEPLTPYEFKQRTLAVVRARQHVLAVTHHPVRIAQPESTYAFHSRHFSEHVDGAAVKERHRHHIDKGNDGLPLPELPELKIGGRVSHVGVVHGGPLFGCADYINYIIKK